jgi:hypothetical protein
MHDGSEDLLKRAVHFQRLAKAVRVRDPAAADDLERLAFKYLELAERAERRAGRSVASR